MSAAWLLERMREFEDRAAVVWRDRTVTYRDLTRLVDTCDQELAAAGVGSGDVATLEGDYSPASCALFLALARRRAILVPLTPSVAAHREEFLDIAEVQVTTTIDDADRRQITRRRTAPTNPLMRQLIERGEPGLVLFSSGSTGASKAALHDLTRLLDKFQVRRQQKCTLTFLLLDHIGGINTLLYTFANGGTVVTVAGRDADSVCRAIAQHHVQILPTSPTFLNLLLMSGAHRRYDASSLELVTYGTEPMPASTLARVHEAWPHVKLQQTYGLSELGILRSKSRSSDSLWVKVGGEGYETKVVDGTLWVRARSAMLGYLNAPSPFDADGWMNTEDQVEVDGEWMRILGRRSELINVGGQKVYPAEVESVLLQIDGVEDATVHGAPNPITGQIVVARLTLAKPEDLSGLKRRVRAFCATRLAPFKVPIGIEIATHDQHTARFKRVRA
ncbi:MAG: long-chain fatty acid--CoA ligase [Acidobacteria bacterium]|nr:long-chain fatty acid--CoA ligase [Acidobacteriota bacterium]